MSMKKWGGGAKTTKNTKKHQNLREKNLWKKIYVDASTAEWPNHGLKSFIYTCSNWFLMNFGCTFFLELIPLQRAVAPVYEWIAVKIPGSITNLSEDSYLFYKTAKA